jgi:nucleotide-binding universal stress UspA family protein
MPVQSISNVAIHNLAVATDFAGTSEHPVQHALAIARHFGATLHLLHLVRPSKFAFVPEMIPAIDEAAGRDSDQYVARLTGTHLLDGVPLERWVEQGEIPEVINPFVKDHHIDMLVVGTHGRSGIPRLLFGSVAQQIFHSVRCPVLVVGPRASGAGPELQLKKVLFFTDLSRESLAAVPWVLTAVEEWRTELDILHVCSSCKPEHEQRLNDLKTSIDAALDGREHGGIRTHLLRGKPTPCVTDFAVHHHEDAIILGLNPHRGVYAGPFWTHAYEIMRHAPCPVLSVRD